MSRNRYVIGDAIARGGMGTVHLGRLLGHSGFVRTVAIKRMHARLLGEGRNFDAFIEEARLAARIEHANVVSPIDVTTLDGEVLIVMPYIPGESLAALVELAAERGETIPTDIAMSIILGVLGGLHAAHEAVGENGMPMGIVHRDVSPQNVLVGNDGTARLLDFGIAKATTQVRPHSTTDGVIKGKLAYMAPEQILGEAATRQSDIYGAGLVLCELLAGQQAVKHAVLDIDVHTILAHVPEAVRKAVVRAVHRIPNERFATAAEFAQALEGVGMAPTSRVARWVESLAGASVRRRESAVANLEQRPPGPLTVGSMTQDLEAPPPAQRPTDRRRLILPISTAALGAVIASVVMMTLTTPRSTPPPALVSGVARPPATSVATATPPPTGVASGTPSAAAIPSTPEPKAPASTSAEPSHLNKGRHPPRGTVRPTTAAPAPNAPAPQPTASSYVVPDTRFF